MRKFLLTFCVTILVFFVSCSSDDTVFIRVKNVSAFDYKELMTMKCDYGDLTSGQVSDYKEFEKAYRYASFKLIVDQDTLNVFAIDYVGETPLVPGKYTYEINVTMSDGGFDQYSLECIKD